MKMKQILFCLLMLVGTVTAKAASQPIGTSTTNWELVNGVLTISGTGDMPNFAALSERPWHSNASTITSVVIGNDITRVGGNAFSSCTSLTDVTVNWADPSTIACGTTPGTSSFEGVTVANVTLHVPSGTEAAYKATEPWMNFNIPVIQTISFTWEKSNFFNGFVLKATNGKTITVDWGDGVSEPKTGAGGGENITHIYSSGSNYTVTITAGADCDLTELSISGFMVHSLDVSGAAKLTTLNCSSIQLTSLDLTANTALTTLNCSYNPLTSLDLTANTALITLNCSFNQLTSLDLIANTALTTLNCSSNLLTSLGLTANTALTTIDCNSNQLTSLVLTANTALTTLNCNSNQLTSLDLTANTSLTSVKCSANQLLASLSLSDDANYSEVSCLMDALTLDKLYAISGLIPTQAYKFLGTQTLPNQTVSKNSAIDLTSVATLGDVTTVLSVKKDDAAAVEGTDYSFTAGMLTFQTTGSFSVEMTNTAIESNVYYPAKVVATYTVTEKTAQTITWSQSLSAATYGDNTITLNATAGSGLAVTYESDDTSVATISGSTLTIVGAGSAKITAKQAGDNTYAAAPDVELTLTVAKKALTVTGMTIADKEYDGTTAATITGWGTLQSVVGSDQVSINQEGVTAHFADAEAGANKAVALSTLTLTGAKAANYTLTQPTGLTATINTPTGGGDPEPVITYHTLSISTGTGILTDKTEDSFHILSGDAFSFVITVGEGYEGLAPTVTVNGITVEILAIGTDKWRCILSDIYEDTNVSVTLNLTGNDRPDALQLYSRGGQLFINTSYSTPVHIYNVSGQCVVSRNLTPGLSSCPLPAGNYIVKLNGLTKKVTVMSKD